MKKYIIVLGFFLSMSIPYSASAALTDSLVSYWKFDESSGNAADTHGSNTLTNNGTIPYVAAKLNNGADLEAGVPEDYFSKTDTTNLSFTGDMSWSWWMKPESNDDTDPAIIQKWGSAGQRAYYIQLRFSVNRIRLGTSAGGTTLNEGDVEVPAFTVNGTTWYHVVLTYDASEGSFTVYVNGADEGTDSTVDTSLFDGTSALEIGRYQEGGGSSNWYDGVLDEVGVWSRELTPSEVTDLYNEGAGLEYPLVPITPITGSGTSNRLAKFTASTTIANSLLSDDGSNITLTLGNFLMTANAALDTITNGALNFGTSMATTMTFGRSGQNLIINSNVGIGTSTPSSKLHVEGDLKMVSLSTVSNCVSSASPAVCGSSPAGSVAMATGGDTLIVNTTAVTADSQILITEDSSLGSRLGLTCNTTVSRTYTISSRTASTSFTIKSSNNPNTNKACLSYWIVN